MVIKSIMKKEHSNCRLSIIDILSVKREFILSQKIDAWARENIRILEGE